MMPVLENLAPGERNHVNHYWLFVINIRDKRFEVLDSIRSLSDKKFNDIVDELVAPIKILWEENYANSAVQIRDYKVEDINPPKQSTT